MEITDLGEIDALDSQGKPFKAWTYRIKTDKGVYYSQVDSELAQPFTRALELMTSLENFGYPGLSYKGLTIRKENEVT